MKLKVKDVKTVREQIYAEQNGICPIFAIHIPEGLAVLDHDHKTKYVRGVLHRSANSIEGIIANACKRYIPADLKEHIYVPDMLRRIADYLEGDQYNCMYPERKRKRKTKTKP